MKRAPLLIATGLALLLHLAAAMALAALDWSPPQRSETHSDPTRPVTFELLQSPDPEPATAAGAEETARPAEPEPAETPPETLPQAEPPEEVAPPPQAEPGTPQAPLDDSPEDAAEATVERDARESLEPLEPAQILEPPTRPQVSAADILASRNLEVANLAQQRLRPPGAGSSRQRRKAINASTQEYIYANYLESWRRKVERIGNLNYPEEAKEKRLYGSLVLHVAVRADGSLEGVRVLRSSGHQVLDEAAVRIVELAAPFAPFPDDIRAHHDVLDITRTWQFLRNQRLGWDQ